jgi:hypothetical protein
LCRGSFSVDGDPPVRKTCIHFIYERSINRVYIGLIVLGDVSGSIYLRTTIFAAAIFLTLQSLLFSSSVCSWLVCYVRFWRFWDGTEYGMNDTNTLLTSGWKENGLEWNRMTRFILRKYPPSIVPCLCLFI